MFFAVPKFEPSIKNWIVPVAVFGVTEAVNDTDWLNIEGFVAGAKTATLTIGVTLLTAWVNTGDVLDAYEASPEKTAVKEWLPAARLETV